VTREPSHGPASATPCHVPHARWFLNLVIFDGSTGRREEALRDGPIDQLGIALGLATLAGLNLYLTVLVAGLAVRFEWVALSSGFGDLAALGNPWVIGVAGALFLIEFFADKLPFVDSVWDLVHTAIRPAGGIALALAALGDMHPVATVVAVLLAGSAALSTHGTKSGLRASLNLSPEPVSNSVASVTEDSLLLSGPEQNRTATVQNRTPRRNKTGFVPFVAAIVWWRAAWLGGSSVAPQDTALPEGNRSGGLRQWGVRLRAACRRHVGTRSEPGRHPAPLAACGKLRGGGGWPPTSVGKAGNALSDPGMFAA